ncbi:MAG: Uma2 family endonuclease [Betaproteobacteria bacterium]|nr:Uma2 family endonuclease [Betaproteobacteria bacterium]
MNAVLTPTGMTPQEYLDWESTKRTKHEYVGGQIYAMTGALESQPHRAQRGDLAQAGPARQACQAFMSDVKLQIDAAQAFYYPDVIVTCDPKRPD